MTPPCVKTTTVSAGSAAIRSAAAPIRSRKAPMPSPPGKAKSSSRAAQRSTAAGSAAAISAKLIPSQRPKSISRRSSSIAKAPSRAQGDFGGLAGPEKRAAEDARPSEPAQRSGQGGRLAPSLRGERRIRPADVPAAAALSPDRRAGRGSIAGHPSPRLLQNKKIPAPSDVGMPYFILDPFPIRDPSPRGPNNTGQPAGRSSGFRIFLRPRLPILLRTVTSSGLCPRLQRRDRDGLAPSSLSPERATRRDMSHLYYSPLPVSRGISGDSGDSSLLHFRLGRYMNETLLNN